MNEQDEAVMDAAIAKARSQIQTFVKALENPTPTQTYFAVKKPFEFQEDGERCKPSSANAVGSQQGCIAKSGSRLPTVTRVCGTALKGFPFKIR